MAPLGAVLRRGVRRGRPRRDRRARAARSIGADPASRGWLAADGRGDARAAVRQVGARHGLLGRGRPRCRPAALRGARRPLRRGGRPLPLVPPGATERRGRARARPRRRRLPAAAGQGRRRSRAPTPQRLAAVRDAVGADVVLFADANGAWTTAAARRFLRATARARLLARAAVRVARGVRRAAAALPAAAGAGRVDRLARGRSCAPAARPVADGVTIKLARVGGVTRAAALRDVAVELGLTRHRRGHRRRLASTPPRCSTSSLSTPEPHRAHTVDFTDWVTVANADGLPQRVDGRMAAPAAPGLGVTVRAESARRAVLPDAVTDPLLLDATPHARGRGRRGGARPARAAGRRRPRADRPRRGTSPTTCSRAASACTA